jgi:hypothetical protein
MNAQERLQAGQMAASDGRYEEALEHFAWYHDHALEEEPSLYGVRLSFALSYWKELGNLYPKALIALNRKRDAKTKILLSGHGDRALFHDVESINDSLGQVQKTHTLFAQLTRRYPDLARDCATLAMPAVVAAGDFKLAERLMPEPVDRVTQLGADLNDSIERQKNKRRDMKIAARRALIHNYAEDVTLMLSVLSARSRAAEAAEVRRLAVKLLVSPSVRKAVKARLDAEVGAPV